MARGLVVQAGIFWENTGQFLAPTGDRPTPDDLFDKGRAR
jgi:hypothetical protein